MHVIFTLEGEREWKEAKKEIRKLMDTDFFFLFENIYKYKYPSSSINLKHKTYAENCIETRHN